MLGSVLGVARASLIMKDLCRPLGGLAIASLESCDASGEHPIAWWA